MSQHFLLSPLAVSLSLEEVYLLSEDEAHDICMKIRWPDEIPTCPKCGCKESWVIKAGRKWKCKAQSRNADTGKREYCSYQYTVTSLTHVHSRKRSFKQILASSLMYVNGAMGVAALSHRRSTKTSYKSPFVFQHKIRAAIEADHERDAANGPYLEGEVEIDGMYVSGSRVKQKPITDQQELEKFFDVYRETHTSLVVVRERANPETMMPGRVRTIHVAKESDAIPFIRRIVKPDTTIHADYSSQYDRLNIFFLMERVNHSKTYKEGNACTNQAESFFSRVRSGQGGVYRNWWKRYAGRYGVEMAWREENSRICNGKQTEKILACLLQTARSPMTGYWQGRHQRMVN